MQGLDHNLASGAAQKAPVHHRKLAAADALTKLHVRQVQHLLRGEAPAEGQGCGGVGETGGLAGGAHVALAACTARRLRAAADQQQRGLRGVARGARAGGRRRRGGADERGHRAARRARGQRRLAEHRLVVDHGVPRRRRGARRARRGQAAGLGIEQQHSGLLRREVDDAHSWRIAGDEASTSLLQAGPRRVPARTCARGVGSWRGQGAPEVGLQAVGAAEVLLGHRVALAPAIGSAPVVCHTKVQVRSAFLRSAISQSAQRLLLALLQVLDGPVQLLLAEQQVAHVQQRQRRVPVGGQRPQQQAVGSLEVALRLPQAGAGHQHVGTGAGTSESPCEF
mmetsp:Transcript_81072/g.229592  ORF Transcript_81072/g.229592 Transcript_81072/m.229592 type:complete len:338 (+) Transcript_81072:990-2003(+)